MAEKENVWVGVQDVSFTPSGESQIDFTILEEGGVEHSPSADTIQLRPASGTYKTFVHVTDVSHEVTVNCHDLSEVDNANLAVGTEGTLTWTAIGRGLASNLVMSSTAKVTGPPNYSGTDGSGHSTTSITFLLMSSDGSTDPLTVT